MCIWLIRQKRFISYHLEMFHFLSLKAYSKIQIMARIQQQTILHFDFFFYMQTYKIKRSSEADNNVYYGHDFYFFFLQIYFHPNIAFIGSAASFKNIYLKTSKLQGSLSSDSSISTLSLFVIQSKGGKKFFLLVSFLRRKYLSTRESHLLLTNTKSSFLTWFLSITNLRSF